MKGEDLEGLDLKELNKLEAIIESRLATVVKTKVGIHVGILNNSQLVSCYHQFVYFLFQCAHDQLSGRADVERDRHSKEGGHRAKPLPI